MPDNVNEVAEQPVIEVAQVEATMMADPEIRKMKPEEAHAAAIEKIEQGSDPVAEQKVAKDDGKRKGKPTAEERISEVTRARKEAEARADAAEQRLKELTDSKPEAKEAPRKEAEAPQIKTVEFNKQKPDLNHFSGTLAEFQEALVDWKLEKKDWDAQQRSVVAQAEAEGNKIRDSFVEREKNAKERLDGYDEVLTQKFQEKFVTSVASPAALAYIVESEVGPEILYELASDEAKLEGFKAMSPAKQVGYLGKLEGKLEKEPAASTKPVTKTPAPDRKLPKGNGGGGKYELPAHFTHAEYERWRNQSK